MDGHSRTSDDNERESDEGSGHATFDSRRETCVRVRGASRYPRRAVSEAAFFDSATVKNSKRNSEVKILVGTVR